jgi:uncharacterized protein YndB with AHSA1/START domain
MSGPGPARGAPAHADLELSVQVAAPPEHTWAVLTDWARQGEWMLGTTVAVTGGDGHSVGSTLSAKTGYGAFGFVDTMEVSEYDAKGRRCVVRHTGRLVRGEGEFAVTPNGRAGMCTVHWSERLELPFGAVGRLGWAAGRGVFSAGVRYSLRRLARLCEAEAGG